MRRRDLKIGMFLIVCVLAVGFAAVATNLFINGNILIGTNEENFDVVFTKSVIDNVDLSNETISKDGKTLIFQTKDLSRLGDKSILDFEVTNKSNQYDATVTMDCVGGSKENEYYTISKNFPDTIAAQTRETGSVVVELKKVSVETITETFTCTLHVNATEREEVAKPLNVCKATQGDGTNVGDMVTCGSESFYVLKNDGTDIRMISEYNLLVGNEANWDGSKWNMTPLASPTGLQDSTAIGAIYKDGSWETVTKRIATTAFSTKDSTYAGSIVEGYVNEYKTTLEGMGVRVKEATLITKEELNELGIVDNTTNNLPGKEWIYKTSYWTRSASSSTIVWRVYSYGIFNHSHFGYDSGFGVRPVISISSSDI